MNELDFIQTVKIQGQGYLLNGTMSVPKADGNKEYELIKQWLEKGNTPIPEFTDEELNQQRISLIKRKCGDIIESKYPLYKQLNITNLLDGYTQEDRIKMIDFINSIRAISNKAELEGTALEDIIWSI